MGSQTKPIRREVELESTCDGVGEVYKELERNLNAHCFSQDDIFSVHLALEEAYINAARHGNKMDSRKKVKISYEVTDDKVVIHVSDEGHGFNPEVVPDPRCGDNIYKDGGRGILLMRSFMDEVNYVDRGNTVRMIKNKTVGNRLC